MAFLAAGQTGGLPDVVVFLGLSLLWLASPVAAWLLVQHRVVSPQSRAFIAAYDSMAGAEAASLTKITEALATQDRLVREIHHRVKNNLQIVASLISIQAREAESPDVARAYAAIQMRVNALALVHRWLFEGSGGNGVDFAALVHDLCAGLQQSIALTDKIEATITARIDRLYVGQDSAVPLAFLITEVVAAACRLAAGNDPGGTLAITVSLDKTGETGLLSLAADVFKAADAFSTSSRLASARIVQGMARQLRGVFEFDMDAGRYSLQFPLFSNR